MSIANVFAQMSSLKIPLLVIILEIAELLKKMFLFKFQINRGKMQIPYFEEVTIPNKPINEGTCTQTMR